MAYGLKYTLTFRDTLNKLGTNYTKLWKLDIYENGYSGSTTTVTGADSPLQLSYKKVSLQTAICGSELTVSLMATSAGQFDEFLTAVPLAYYANVYNSTDGGTTWNGYWSGTITTDTYTQAHSNAPYPCNIKFNCGLGELQWHRYENAGALTTGLETVLEVISNCLSFLPYPKNIIEIINVREDTMSDTAGLLEQLYINNMAITEIGNDGETHGWNCNKLLNAILTSINCRMYQAGNVWYIERIYERVNTSVSVFTYSTYSYWQTANDWLRGGTWPQGTLSTLTLTRSISNSTIPFIQVSSENAVTQIQPILTYKFNTGNINNLQLIPSPFLEDTPVDKDANGRPLRWDASYGTPPNVVSVGGDKLETVDPYDPDTKYQSGYSFGQAVTAANKTYIDTNYKYFMANPPFYFTGSPYYLHAVRNHGDTFTLPYFYLDPANGSIAMNIRYYLRILFTPSYTSTPSYTQLQKDSAYILGGNPCITFMHQMMFYRPYDNTTLYWSGQNQNSNNYSWNGGATPTKTLTSQYNFNYMNNNFPYQTGVGYKYSSPTNGGITQAQLMALLAASWDNTHHVANPFSISFDITDTWEAGMNPSSGSPPFGLLPQVLQFDFKTFPAYIWTGGTTPAGIKVVASIDDYAIRAVDLQYKDNAQSATSNISFYSASAAQTRWNELVINAAFGDTNSQGYPGSFSVYTGANTTTWHTRTLSDTGTILADIFFKKFAQIVSNYRNNLRGNVIYDNTLQMWHSVLDEDGTLYIQLGHTFDIKYNKFTTDMEGMADLGNTITTVKSSPGTSISKGVPIRTSTQLVTPLVSQSAATPIKMQTGVTSLANPAYPQ